MHYFVFIFVIALTVAHAQVASHQEKSRPGRAAEREAPCSLKEIRMEKWRDLESTAAVRRDDELRNLMRLYARYRAIDTNLRIEAPSEFKDGKQSDTGNYLRAERTKLTDDLAGAICRIRLGETVAAASKGEIDAFRPKSVAEIGTAKGEIPLIKACGILQACLSTTLVDREACDRVSSLLRAPPPMARFDARFGLGRSFHGGTHEEPNLAEEALAWHAYVGVRSPDPKRFVAIEKGTDAENAAKALKDRLKNNLESDLKQFGKNFDRSHSWRGDAQRELLARATEHESGGRRLSAQRLRAQAKEESENLARARANLIKNYRAFVDDFSEKQKYFRPVLDTRTGVVRVAPTEALQELQFRQAFALGSHATSNTGFVSGYFRPNPFLAPDSISASIDHFIVQGEAVPRLFGEIHERGKTGLQVDPVPLELAGGGFLSVARFGLRAGVRSFFQEQAKDWAKDWATDQADKAAEHLGFGEGNLRFAIALAARDYRGASGSIAGIVSGDAKEAELREKAGQYEAADPFSAKGKQGIVSWSLDPRFTEPVETDPVACRRELFQYHLARLRKTVDAQLRANPNARVRLSSGQRRWLAGYERYNPVLGLTHGQDDGTALSTVARYLTEAALWYEPNRHPILGRPGLTEAQRREISTTREELESIENLRLLAAAIRP